MGKRRMNIALIMPKSTFLELPMVMQPLGLFYLAARLESLGHTTEFFDLNIDPLPEDRYDQIWVSATSPQMAEVKKISIETLDYRAERVLGGASVWANPESCKHLGYDLIVGGESDSPENTQAILDALEGKPYEKHLTVPISRTLDWVLPPVRRWSGKYNSFLTDLHGVKVPCTTMFTSRGCPLECAFCESGRHGVIWDRLTRYESLELVEHQIQECAELGFTGLAYYDDVFILNKKRTLPMLEMHKEHDMVFRCFLRSDILCNHGGKEYLEAMRDGGLIEIFVGVESADNEIKNNIHKKTTIEQDTAVLEWCRELGIRCKMSFILGLPGENIDSMERRSE